MPAVTILQNLKHAAAELPCMHPQRFLLLVHALIWAAFGALIGLIILDAKLKVWTQAESTPRGSYTCNTEAFL